MNLKKEEMSINEYQDLKKKAIKSLVTTCFYGIVGSMIIYIVFSCIHEICRVDCFSNDGDLRTINDIYIFKIGFKIETYLISIICCLYPLKRNFSWLQGAKKEDLIDCRSKTKVLMRYYLLAVVLFCVVYGGVLYVMMPIMTPKLLECFKVFKEVSENLNYIYITVLIAMIIIPYTVRFCIKIWKE